jgi:hypothetical protein
MRARCNNPNVRGYENYGGRGIAVCERWDAYANFVADMGEKPEGKTLDRIDNSKGYSPSNCRWATRAEQSRNTRRNINVCIGGTVRCLKDWQLLLDIPARAVMRLADALQMPLRGEGV